MQRLPVIAIVGRPNVGKSTLFNRLTGSRQAVVDDTPGVTRDRIYGEGEAFGKYFRLIDTGGLDSAFGDDISAAAQMQSQLAIDEADIIVFMLDGASGISSVDHEVAESLRRSGKPILLVANKLESLRKAELDAVWDLRLGEPLPISALHGTQVGDLLEKLNELLPDTPEADEDDGEDEIVKIAVVGRPNVGKSSLINAIIGEQRLIVSSQAGTTRDAIDTDFQHGEQRFRLVDTAGIRRKAKVKEALEYYCVLRAMDAIDRSDVVVLCLDACEGLTDQDKRIADMAVKAGRGLIFVVNKWDLFKRYLADRDRSGIQVHDEMARRTFNATERTAPRQYAKALRDILPACQYAPMIVTTAIAADGVDKVLAEAANVAEHHAFRVPTGEINRVIRDVLDERPPQMRHGKRLKVLYATQVKVKPPTFVMFVNDPELVHFSFSRFVENRLRETYNFEGTPVKIFWRSRREEDQD